MKSSYNDIQADWHGFRRCPTRFQRRQVQVSAYHKKVSSTPSPLHLERVTADTVTPYEKDLGVWVAIDLTWSKHITEGCAKANKLLGFLRRTTLDIGSVRTRRTLYLAVVRPALGYATRFGALGLLNWLRNLNESRGELLNISWACHFSA